MSVPLLRDVWIETFHQQATRQLMARCRRQARWCLHEYRLAASPGDDDDLVQNALADIFDKRIQWDPSRRSLLDQVCDVVRYRIRNLKRSTVAYRGVCVLVDNESQSVHVEAVAVSAEEPDDPEAQLRHKQARELGARIGAELAALVANQADDEAAAILACWWSGTSERKDILVETGMSAEAYHGARRRLVRLAGRLSDELRAKAKADVE